MSESVAAVALTPVRTLSKSSARSPLSSSENSAPGSPNHPGLSSSPDINGNTSSSAGSRDAASSSPPPLLHEFTENNNIQEPEQPAPQTSSAAAPAVPSSILGSSSSERDAVSERPASSATNTVQSGAASNTSAAPASQPPQTSQSVQPTLSAQRTPPTRPQTSGLARRPSFGLSFLSSLSNTIRGSHSLQSLSQQSHQETSFNTGTAAAPAAAAGSLHSHNQTDSHSHSHLHSHNHTHAPTQNHYFMSNSPTIANLNGFTDASADLNMTAGSSNSLSENQGASAQPPFLARQDTIVRSQPIISEETAESQAEALEKEDTTGKDKDGFYSVRLTPIIDHLTSNTGLYFSPMIRRIKPKDLISIGRYTEKNKSAAHAPQGSSAPIVFKSKVVSRTHAMFQCNEDGSWFLKDCKSSSGTFLNNVRLSQASQELTLWPLIDGDIVQLGLDYRGGTEEVYRCVKMRCEFNRSWQRKVNQFNLDIHKKMKKLGLDSDKQEGSSEFSECAICLLKLEPCQALFISPCSHSWHYKCIRPIIIKSYPQFYCPNCRSMCDLETDIEDE